MIDFDEDKSHVLHMCIECLNSVFQARTLDGRADLDAFDEYRGGCLKDLGVNNHFIVNKKMGKLGEVLNI